MWNVSISARVDGLGIVLPVERPHAPEQIGGLRRRVGQELRDDLDVARRPDDGDHGEQIDGIAAEPLGRREALPRRALADCRRLRHWNTCRSQAEAISLTMMMAMMASRMVSTKS